MYQGGGGGGGVSDAHSQLGSLGWSLWSFYYTEVIQYAAAKCMEQRENNCVLRNTKQNAFYYKF